MPLLNREGPEAVARAWAVVVEQHSGPRAPSSGAVRAALTARGLALPVQRGPRGLQIRTIGKGLKTLTDRVARVKADLDGRLLPASARAQMAEYATAAHQLATDLEGLADASIIGAATGPGHVP